MELVRLLRTLWSFRIAVVVGIIVAVVLGFLATRGTTTHFGVASMRVVLDTPRSQTVDVDPEGADTLEWRAALIADVMGSGPARQDIARRMGIAEAELVVSAPYFNVPEVEVPLASAALDAAAVVPEPYEVAIQGVILLPIIDIDARAPTREAAAKLASAAADAIGAGSVGTPTAKQYVQKLVVDHVGPVRAKDVTDRPRRLLGLIVAAIVVAVWCTAIVLLDGLANRRIIPTPAKSI